MKCLVKSPFIVAIVLLALLSACSRGKQMRERMTALYLKGRVHHDLGEAPQALDCYQRAVAQTDNRFRVAIDTKNILRLTIGA